MPALPNGWLDTGLTHTQTITLQVAPKTFGSSIAWEVLEIEGWVIASYPEPLSVPVDGCPPGTLGGDYGMRTGYTAYINQTGAPFSSRTILDGAAVSDCDGVYHALQTITKTFGPLRLGVTVELDSFTGLSNLRYAWFADAATETKTVFAGVTIYDSFDYASPTLVGAGAALEIRVLSNSFSPVPASSDPVAKIANASGDSDPVTLSTITLPFVVTAPELAETKFYQSGPFSGYLFFFGPNYRFTADLQVTWAGGADTFADAQVYATVPPGVSFNLATLSSPAYNPIRAANNSWDTLNGWDGALRAQLDPSWSGAQIPALPAGQLGIQSSRTKPKRPANGPESWSPLEVTIASPVPVLLSTNLWVAAGAVTVAGSVFTVTAGGASVTRAFKSKWRNWNTIGDPDYHSDDLFTTTKHNYYANDGQDVWGWSLYAYLDVGLTCPSASTLSFTLSMAVPGATPYLFTRTYTKAFPNGASVQRIDLLFPDDSGSQPCFFERVDQIVIAGFNNGAYTLGVMQLVAAEQAYLKIGARGGWTGIDIAQDGSGPNVQWGRNPLVNGGPAYQKDDEDGLFMSDSGTAIYGGCFRTDGTLQAAATEMNRMEGLTVADNSTAMDADLADTFANQIGFLDGAAVPLVPQANWLQPNLPHTRMGANALTTFPASIPCDSFQIVPAPPGTFVIVWRRILGMILESLVTTAALARAGAGARVALQITGGTTPHPMSDPAVMVAATDASGYVWAWVGTGDYLGFSDYTVYFTGVS